MAGSFLLMFREGLEAALIVGIILGYLAKINKSNLNSYIYGGVVSALVASGVTAYLFEKWAGGFAGKNEEMFEGIIMIVAVILLTTMILWMKEQSKTVQGDIQKKIDEVISSNRAWGLASLAFLSVYREGVEVVLFFKAISTDNSASDLYLGSILGLAAAVILAYLIFKSTIKLNLSQFFKITGGIVIFIAAGLFAHGIHELQEARVFPVVIEHIYDVNGILNEKGTIGSLLKAMFGYNGNPSLLEVIGYWIYLIVAVPQFFQLKLNAK